MRFKAAVIALIGVWFIGVSYTAQTQAQGKTVWDGVYTEEQAKRGAAAYTKACAECHKEDFAGDGFAPPLAGPDFSNNWNSLSVGDLFERIRISMPPGQESSVSPEAKADIVAHLLKANKFPAGTTELSPKAEALKGIQFLAQKPGN